MPVYKTEPFLREAIDSMLSQTFTDFELIVLNDCSPDNAEEILDDYKDSRIVRYLGEKNAGLANVLNVGMQMARGKYIARMDSDDISAPNRLEVQVNYLEQHPDVDLCSCGMNLFGAMDDQWIRESDIETVRINALFFSPVLHASSIWRRDAFDRLGLRFRQEMVPAEDYDLWCRALSGGLHLMNIPECMYQYRIHPNQATVNTEKRLQKEQIAREGYLHTLFPNAEEKDIVSIAAMKPCLDPDVFKVTADKLLEMNADNVFFNEEKLRKYLKKHYKYLIGETLHEHFSWRLYRVLTLKEKIKWVRSFLNRIFKHNR
jgi:glycosyltransferase involved in cell wall biosynthesis